MDTVVLVTGGFDPVHSGHLALIQEAQKLGPVIVGVNSDDWLVRKKGAAFLPLSERKLIMSSLKGVLMAFSFDDADGSAVDAIRKAKRIFPESQLVFANGGDRTTGNTPEQFAFQSDPQVVFAFGVGGEEKKNSSSWVLDQWKSA